jgi:hypothetical protein
MRQRVANLRDPSRASLEYLRGKRNELRNTDQVNEKLQQKRPVYHRNNTEQ